MSIIDMADNLYSDYYQNQSTHSLEKIREMLEAELLLCAIPITPCSECSGQERVATMKRWKWKCCPDCGRKI